MQIALPRPTFEPNISFLDVDHFRVSEAPYQQGMEEHYVEGSLLKVYSTSKTVVDLFKFRSRHGTDLALDVLRDTWRERKATIKELLAAAKICRVERIMELYLEVTVSLPDRTRRIRSGSGSSSTKSFVQKTFGSFHPG